MRSSIVKLVALCGLSPVAHAQVDEEQVGAWYFAFYNEIFINGQRDIGNGRTVEVFDRNRFYVAIGHSLGDKLRIQSGYVHQYTNNVEKGQIQLSLHQSF